MGPLAVLTESAPAPFECTVTRVSAHRHSPGLLFTRGAHSPLRPVSFRGSCTQCEGFTQCHQGKQWPDYKGHKDQSHTPVTASSDVVACSCLVATPALLLTLRLPDNCRMEAPSLGSPHSALTPRFFWRPLEGTGIPPFFRPGSTLKRPRTEELLSSPLGTQVPLVALWLDLEGAGTRAPPLWVLSLSGLYTQQEEKVALIRGGAFALEPGCMQAHHLNHNSITWKNFMLW